MKESDCASAACRRIGLPAAMLACLGLASCASTVAVDAKPESHDVVSRIAFGSCLEQDKPQPIWHAVLDANPDLFVFLGDNVYADATDRETLRAAYSELAAEPGFAALTRASEILATWDDHDYGLDDSGAENPIKEESKQVFLDFFGEPADSPRRRRPGIYDAKIFGPPGKRVQVILLDTRTFRGPLEKDADAFAAESRAERYRPTRDRTATMLGEAQWAWLERRLHEPAELRIVASSIQVLSEEHGWEKWGNFPHERARLLELLGDPALGRVILLSGDRHFAEISRVEPAGCSQLFDVTSSSLNLPLAKPGEPNRHRVGAPYFGANFGLVTVDWTATEPAVALSILSERGETAIRIEIPLVQHRSGEGGGCEERS